MYYKKVTQGSQEERNANKIALHWPSLQGTKETVSADFVEE